MDSEYSQGICGDGAAILKDGVMLTIDEIVAELTGLRQQLAAAEARVAYVTGGNVMLQGECERLNEQLAAALAGRELAVSLLRDALPLVTIARWDGLKDRIDTFLATTAENDAGAAQGDSP